MINITNIIIVQQRITDNFKQELLFIITKRGKYDRDLSDPVLQGSLPNDHLLSIKTILARAVIGWSLLTGYYQTGIMIFANINCHHYTKYFRSTSKLSVLNYTIYMYVIMSCATNTTRTLQ